MIERSEKAKCRIIRRHTISAEASDYGVVFFFLSLTIVGGPTVSQGWATVTPVMSEPI